MCSIHELTSALCVLSFVNRYKRLAFMFGSSEEDEKWKNTKYEIESKKKEKENSLYLLPTYESLF